jgi:hypothetical protein
MLLLVLLSLGVIGYYPPYAPKLVHNSYVAPPYYKRV